MPAPLKERWSRRSCLFDRLREVIVPLRSLVLVLPFPVLPSAVASHPDAPRSVGPAPYPF